MSLTLIDLRDNRDTWEPSDLLAPSAEAIWPGATALIALSSVSVTLPAQSSKTGDRPLITPRDVDVSTGTVSTTTRRLKGSGYWIGRSGLQHGDLIVTGTRPSIFVTEAFDGLAFSAAFTAIRCKEIDPLWVWAVLNSSNGSRLRSTRTRKTGAGTSMPLAVARIVIPAAPMTWDRTQSERLVNHLAKDVERQDAGQSWTRWTTLPREGSWQREYLLRDPSLFAAGTPLRDLIVSVSAGRRADKLSGGSTKAFPVYSVPQLKGEPVAEFAVTDESRVVRIGDLLLQEVGVKGTALAATEECIAGSGVLHVRLTGDTSSDDVAAFLRSPVGQRQRAALVTGATIPRISRASVAEFRLLDEFERAAPSVSLATQLDELLS